MPRPLLPPRGVFLPIRLLFDDQLTPAALQTWAQLRALAWGKPETPSLSLQQIYEMTGKKPSTLYGHMAILRDRGALRWRPAGSGTLIVSFEGHPVDDFPDDSENPENFSGNLEKPSLNTSNLNQLDSESDRERGGGFQKSGKNGRQRGALRPEDALLFQDSGKALQKSGKKFQESGKEGAQSAGPVQRYRQLTRLSPNPSQRETIQGAVTDLALWEACLTHWLSHGWNPRNLPGLLDLYARGGPAACRYCQADRARPRSPGPSPLDQNFSTIDDLRKELTHG